MAQERLDGLETRFGNSRGDRTVVQKWLYGIARSNCYNNRRQHQQQQLGRRVVDEVHIARVDGGSLAVFLADSKYVAVIDDPHVTAMRVFYVPDHRLM